jgi:hypothetical protein
MSIGNINNERDHKTATKQGSKEINKNKKRKSRQRKQYSSDEEDEEPNIVERRSSPRLQHSVRKPLTQLSSNDDDCNNQDRPDPDFRSDDLSNSESDDNNRKPRANKNHPKYNAIK